MFLAKLALPRRTFLRGLGATIGLPLLEAMVPAMTAVARTAAAPVPRLGFIYHPMGTIYDQWTPAREGTQFDMPRILAPLAPHRDRLMVVTGLAHQEGASKGDGSFPHPRAGAVWLSGVHASAVTTVGAEVRLGPTADQIAARTIGKQTLVPSLEMALEQPSAFACDGSTCLFTSTFCWKDEKTPVPMESHPRIVFERLFGSGGSVDDRRADRRTDASILDSVAGDAARLQQRLGASDRLRLTEYLDGVREIERRISRSEGPAESVLELPDRPSEIPADWEEHAKLMFDLQVLAFKSDTTRVFSLMMGRELSGQVFRKLGQSEQHHIITHHRNDQRLAEQKVQIDIYHMQVLRYFLDKLHETRDGDQSLLDSSLIVYGSAMGDGNQHAFHDIPTLILGKGAGRISSGRHIKRQDVPMTNLLLSVLDRVGVPVDKLGDSTGSSTSDRLEEVPHVIRRWRYSLIVVLIAGGAQHQTTAQAQEAVVAPADVEDGQRLYLGACTNCHGPDGDVVPGVDFSHGKFRRASSDAELADIVRRGIPGTAMPPGNYSSRQASLIVAYLRSMATTESKATATGDPARGKVLFEGGGQCLTCHQVQGNGSRLGPDLTEIGRLRRVSELERALVDPAPEVRPQNRMARVVTRDGATITGRLLHHDTFTLLLLDSQEELRAFNKADLRDLTVIKSNPKTSYRGRLTMQELADVIGYLVTLKGTRASRP